MIDISVRNNNLEDLGEKNGMKPRLENREEYLP